jgi:hypothetical protein
MRWCSEYTAAGSTYNPSAYAYFAIRYISPALTRFAFASRRWRGAVLPSNVKIRFEVRQL